MPVLNTSKDTVTEQEVEQIDKLADDLTTKVNVTLNEGLTGLADGDEGVDAPAVRGLVISNLIEQFVGDYPHYAQGLHELVQQSVIDGMVKVLTK